MAQLCKKKKNYYDVYKTRYTQNDDVLLKSKIQNDWNATFNGPNILWFERN